MKYIIKCIVGGKYMTNVQYIITYIIYVRSYEYPVKVLKDFGSRFRT